MKLLQNFFLNLLDYQDSDTCSKKDIFSTKWFVVVESFGLKFCRTKSTPSLWRGETLKNIGFLNVLALTPHDQFIKNLLQRRKPMILQWNTFILEERYRVKPTRKK